MAATLKNQSQQEFCSYQRKIIGKTPYLAVNRFQIVKLNSKFTTRYYLDSIPTIGNLMYWILTVNSGIKSVFLAFLALEYFGPVEFVDKIAVLDYVLCVALTCLSWSIYFNKYPFYGKLI